MVYLVAFIVCQMTNYPSQEKNSIKLNITDRLLEITSKIVTGMKQVERNLIRRMSFEQYMKYCEWIIMRVDNENKG